MKRPFATILQDGKPNKVVILALSSPIDTVRMVISPSNSVNSLLLLTTIQPTTAALVVNKLLRRLHYQLFQLLQIKSTINVLTNQRMKETGESLSIASLSETTSTSAISSMVNTANKHAVKEMRRSRLIFHRINSHKDLSNQSKPSVESKPLILERSSTKLPTSLQREPSAVSEDSNSIKKNLEHNH